MLANSVLVAPTGDGFKESVLCKFRLCSIQYGNPIKPSTAPARHFPSVVQTLEGVIREQANGRKLVAGLSLWGYVAMELARQFPELVAGLVLSGCSLNFEGILGSYLKLAGWLMRRGWLKLRKEQAEKRVRGMFPPALTDVAEAQLRSRAFPEALGPSYAELAGRDFTAVLGEYPGPSLILNGERDSVSRRGESKFVAVARRGRAWLIPGAGHACNLDQPEKYNLAVREFAQSIHWISRQTEFRNG